MLRIDTAGVSDLIQIADFTTAYSEIWSVPTYMITNGDTGALLSWSSWDTPTGLLGMATTAGTSASIISAPQLPGQIDAVVPVLQAQDGSFVGTAWTGEDGDVPYMVAFDATGNVRWSVPGYGPKIATADGGVIAQAWEEAMWDFTGAVATFDQNGNATGQMASLSIQSWTMNNYQVGAIEQVLMNPILFALSYWPFEGANPSHTSTAPFPVDSITNARVSALSFQQFDPGDGPYETEARPPTGLAIHAHDLTGTTDISGILSSTRWQSFAPTHCATVFADPGHGIASSVPYYSLTRAQDKQHRLTNYYDLGNPGVANLKVYDVTAHETPNSPQTLAGYLQNVTAATVNMGETKHTAVLLKAGFFQQTPPAAPVRFTLMHETLLHAYGNWWDDPIYGNSFFTQNGLWRVAGSTATTTISTWMSTDCSCTPENPATANTCKGNTAKW